MNFDIKYTKYLQIFNFIKIKQVLNTFMGAQSWESLAWHFEQTWVQSGCS